MIPPPLYFARLDGSTHRHGPGKDRDRSFPAGDGGILGA